MPNLVQIEKALHIIVNLCDNPHWTMDRRDRIRGLAAECLKELNRPETIVEEEKK